MASNQFFLSKPVSEKINPSIDQFKPSFPPFHHSKSANITANSYKSRFAQIDPHYQKLTPKLDAMYQPPHQTIPRPKILVHIKPVSLTSIKLAVSMTSIKSSFQAPMDLPIPPIASTLTTIFRTKLFFAADASTCFIQSTNSINIFAHAFLAPTELGQKHRKY